jgi:2-methylcitrate dehydratase PrpD
MSAGITETLARFASTLTYDRLPPQAVIAAKQVFLDWLGNVYAGSVTQAGRIVAEVAAEQGGPPEALAIGHGWRGPALAAALTNGANCHCVEFDDIYKMAIYHPGAPTIAAALAMAERFRLDGRRLLTAIVAGYEVGTRIGEATAPSHYRYWHTTGTVGTFGAAAAAGNALGLDPVQMAWALGTAGSQAAGLWQFMEDGQTMTKPLHAGKAASNGALSALLARRGFDGATRILEGEKGFCNATSQGWSFDAVLRTLGEKWNVAHTTFKAYSSCGHTHPAIDAVLALVKEHGLTVEDVQRVEVHTYAEAIAVAGNPAPRTTHQAKFSIPYCVALALRFGRIGMNEFDQDRIGDPLTAAVMQRIRVDEDPALTAVVPGKRPAIVELEIRSGRRLQQRVDYRKGDPENPLTQEDLEAKFRLLASARLSEAQARASTRVVGELERMEDVTAIFGS